ncbi:MAG: hypothetical protein ACLRMZ_00495 [Blautia marasmi]
MIAVLSCSMKTPGDVKINNLAIASVSSSGDNIGGVTGKNYGKLNNDYSFALSGSVNGNKSVGGYAGSNMDNPVQSTIMHLLLLLTGS